MIRKPVLSPALFVIALSVAAFILFFGGWCIEFAADMLWFGSEGVSGVFWRMRLWPLAFGVAGGLFSTLFLFSNILWAYSQTEEPVLLLPPELAATPLADLLERVSIRKLFLIAAAVIGVVAGIVVAPWWSEALLMIRSDTFGYTDPIHSRDAGFYIFTLPVLERLRALIWTLTFVSLIFSTLIHLLHGSISFPLAEVEGRLMPQGISIRPPARRHLATHALWIFILLAVQFFLRRYQIMFRPAGGGVFDGPGHADVYGTMPLILALSVTTIFAGMMVFHGIEKANIRTIVLALLLVMTASVIEQGYPRLLQRFSVLPNQLNRERTWMGHNIHATRFAFGLADAEERQLTGENRLTAEDIRENRPTINNVRLWDHLPLLETFAQVQEIRTYYEFNYVDNDRYLIDGELRQTMLSPRELDVDSLPQDTWVNRRLIYTHGYGVALGTVNQVTPEGLPELLVKDIPPQVSVDSLRIDRPEIYFGELAHPGVFVRTEQKEFDYPSGEENVYATYSGDGGIPIGNPLVRAVFASRFSDLKMMLSGDLGGEARLLIRRNILERVRTVAPFLTFDPDPYMVIHEGRLVWIIDAYTHTSRFPYSHDFTSGRRSSEVNYMRNSVKATVDAYDGGMKFYLADAGDPIASAWSRIFPGLIRPLEEMPPDLRAHLRHPEMLFRVQAEVYKIYHMTDPQTFYNREDQWETPTSGREARLMEPYYTVMRLPGEEREEFILMQPFTPRGKSNLAAWMVARNDGEKRGQLVVYSFPKDRLIYGPEQIIARMNQDERISPQLTLWNQQGSEVVFGTLLVIPVEESLIYVQPLYLRAHSGSIPELKRVIVGYQDQFAMEPTLDRALAAIFERRGGDAPPSVVPSAASPTTPSGATSSNLSGGTGGVHETILRAEEHYDAATRAAREGDWAAYGERLRQLGQALEEARRLSRPEAP